MTIAARGEQRLEFNLYISGTDEANAENPTEDKA